MLELQSEVEPSRWSIRLSNESLITGRQLRQLLGNCSEMHIWRLLNKQKLQSLAFPKPTKINGRNYWRLGAIRQWIEDQEAKSRAHAPPAVPAVEGNKRRERRRKPR
jgi:predicted DNA-binding transcriptional regulator AlpA